MDRTTATGSTTYTYPDFRPLSAGTNVFPATVTAVDNDGGLSSQNAGGAPGAPRAVPVTVNRQPVAAFTVNRSSGGDCGAASPCVLNLPTPYSVTVNGTANAPGGSSDADGTITSYAWAISTLSGGGTPPSLTGSVPSGTLTFPGPGLYAVSLTVRDNNNGQTTTTRQVRVNTAPVVSLGGTPPYSCLRQPTPTSPPSCTITASATDAENDAVTSYTWEFLDDGGTRIGNLVTTPTGSVSPVFTITGSGTVRVFATDANAGQSATVSAAFTVANQPPTVSVATSPSPAVITPSNAGAPQFVTLTATAADPDGGTVAYAWSVKNSGGTEVLTGTASTLRVGPGAPSPLPAGRYDVTVTVTDGQGGSTTSPVVLVVVNTAPNAVASASPSVVNGSASPVVTFDGSASNDPDGGSLVSYAWTVTGPGGFSTTASGATPAPITLGACGTANPCNFVATLTVTDNEGGIGSTTVVVKRNQVPVAGATLTPQPQTSPATPACTLSPTATCVSNPPGDLRVDASTSTDPDGSITTTTWRLFDAAALASNPAVAPLQTRTGQVADFTRPSGGLYVVELTVTDDSGAATTLRANVNVNRAPTATINGPATLLVDRQVPFNFAATVSDPDGESLSSFEWTYTSGSTVLATDTTSDPSSVQTFNVLVTNGTVTLKVTDPSGGSTTVTKPFQVRNQVPRAVLNQDPTDSVGSPGFTATFSSSSVDNDGQVLTATLQV
ncbi:MAG: PKD domain-containing protein, partial [Actinomycetes bacterium]